MKFLILISFRNLLRQKRRNLLLGSAMAIGMAILVIAQAFSHGISEVIFNRILTYVTGHVSVAFTVKGNLNSQVFQDGDRMLSLVRERVPNASRVEEAVGVFTRAVGSGVSDNIILVGADVGREATEKEKEEMRQNFPMVEGTFEELARTDVENPVIVAAEKAAYLRVKRGDVMRGRFQDIFGRNQAVRLSVVGVFKPSNPFMSVPVFLELGRLKKLAGYGPHDISRLHITLPDPKEAAVESADSLHAALAPSLASAFGTARARGRGVSATVLGFKVDSVSLRGLSAALGLPEGPGGAGSKEVLAGKELADSLGLRAGEACTLSYRARHDSAPASAAFRITGIIPASGGIPGNLLLVNDRDFYAFYYAAWPAASDSAFRPGPDHRLFPLVNREWVLMERTRTTSEMQKKYREATRWKTRANLVDVQTMYESASMIVNLEYALNLITFVAVLVLFLIIQVGVVNTLRMAIKERTREIGTMRAIGMPRGDVRALFLLETFFLSAAACAAGLALAFGGMALLRRLAFDMEGNPLGMLLVNGHLQFLPTVAGTLAYVGFILGIASLTAWFPARRAARLSPSEALRHFG